MPSHPPELMNTAEKLAAARTRRDELRERVDKLAKAWTESQEQHYKACQRLEDAPAAVRRANEALTAAMRSGDPVGPIQAQVAAATADIESIRQLRDEAAAIEQQRRAVLEGPSKALAQAELDLEEAEFLHLTAAIAALALDMRPLCVRYRALAHKRSIGLNDSGLLLDDTRPNIGQYRLLPDGSLAAQYFAKIA